MDLLLTFGAVGKHSSLLGHGQVEEGPVCCFWQMQVSIEQICRPSQSAFICSRTLSTGAGEQIVLGGPRAVFRQNNTQKRSLRFLTPFL